MSKPPALFKKCQLQWESCPLAFTIENLFSHEECNELIQLSESRGFEAALVNIGGGQQLLISDYRKSERCIIDDEVLANNFWKRILAAIDELTPDQREDLNINALNQKSHWLPVGLNERLRFLKYKPGDFFQPHSDGSYQRDQPGPRQGERSFVTCQIYLNDCPGGGHTAFHSYTQGAESFYVPCKTGSVLLFDHHLQHEGCPVTKGCKYAIRTDLMYTQQGPGHEYHLQSEQNPNSNNTSDTK